MTLVSDITLPQGVDRTIVVSCNKRLTDDTIQPLDLTLGGTKVWFTVKRRLDDADVDSLIRKGFNVGGLSGISVNTPSSAEKNKATIEIDAADWPADNPGSLFHYDVQVETGGEQFRTHRGFVRAPRGATRA